MPDPLAGHYSATGPFLYFFVVLCPIYGSSTQLRLYFLCFQLKPSELCTGSCHRSTTLFAFLPLAGIPYILVWWSPFLSIAARFYPQACLSQVIHPFLPGSGIRPRIFGPQGHCASIPSVCH